MVCGSRSLGGLRVVETVLRWVVAATALVVLAALIHGVTRAQGRAPGRATGAASRVLRGPVEALIGLAILIVGVLLWRPLPLEPPELQRPWWSLVGALLAIAGLALVLWGRLTLGDLYDVSSVAGARLRSSHRLIESGPFAYVRHPMYVGVEAAAIGGLMLYRTWSLAFLAVAFVGLVLRAAREDELLRLEFGEEWEAYRRRVPAWLPRLGRSGGSR